VQARPLACFLINILKEDTTMAKTETRTRIKPNIKINEPRMFKLIYFNDEVTTMEFVVNSLIDHFQYNQDTALKITEDIHTGGSAVVAVLPYEIAEQKGIEVTLQARNEGFPLQIKIESEA
jgi:ATP-dependent Clp protease adaptor protein ClpS